MTGSNHTANIKITDNQLSEMEAELEIESNKLLEEAGFINADKHIRRNNDSGCYTEIQLNKHRRNEVSNYGDGLNIVRIALRDETEMIMPDIRKLCVLAGFSDEQILIWTLYHQGLSCADIAQICNVSRQCMHKRIEVCRKRLIKTIILYPWFGWYDVYLAEIHRN